MCGLSFVVSGVLELELKKGYPELPKEDQLKVFIFNGLDCPVDVKPSTFELGKKRPIL